jgi:hypothetical protein
MGKKMCFRNEYHNAASTYVQLLMSTQAPQWQYNLFSKKFGKLSLLGVM